MGAGGVMSVRIPYHASISTDGFAFRSQMSLSSHALVLFAVASNTTTLYYVFLYLCIYIICNLYSVFHTLFSVFFSVCCMQYSVFYILYSAFYILVHKTVLVCVLYCVFSQCTSTLQFCILVDTSIYTSIHYFTGW